MLNNNKKIQQAVDGNKRGALEWDVKSGVNKVIGRSQMELSKTIQKRYNRMRSMTLPKLDNWWCNISIGFFFLIFIDFFWLDKSKKLQKKLVFHHSVRKCIATRCERKFLERGNCACYALRSGEKKNRKSKEQRKEKNGLAHFINEFYIITLLRHYGLHTATHT